MLKMTDIMCSNPLLVSELGGNGARKKENFQRCTSFAEKQLSPCLSKSVLFSTRTLITDHGMACLI